jgi:hypothetical protein
MTTSTPGLVKRSTIVRPRVIRYNNHFRLSLPLDVEDGTVIIVNGIPRKILYSEEWHDLKEDIVCIRCDLTSRCDNVFETFTDLIQAAAQDQFSLCFLLEVDHPEVVRQLGESLETPPVRFIRFYPERPVKRFSVHGTRYNNFEFEFDIALPTTARGVRKRLIEYASKRSKLLLRGVHIRMLPILCFPYHAEQMIGQCLALVSLDLPPYVLLEIVDWLPYVQDMSHWYKIKHLIAIRESIRRVWGRRDSNQR